MSRRLRLRHVVATLLVVIAPVAAGCSTDDDPTPEELRRDRIETRLTGTFPKAQATCILDGLDDATMIALDRSADLDPDSDALRAYSFLVRACVEDPSATAPTTTVPETTTTPGDQPDQSDETTSSAAG